jgi:hypothetical protein
MSEIAKMILFGEDYASEYAFLDFKNLIDYKDLGIEDQDIRKTEENTKNKNISEINGHMKSSNAGKKITIKNKLGARTSEKEEKKHNVNESNDYLVPLIPKAPVEKDLDLKLICISEGEKIYKLSDLFIPKDEKVIRKIEKYNNKIMTISEKDKNDKEQDIHKKDTNEFEEIKNLIRKTKRNQKFTKINITYNEKFFDRTFFLDNFYPEKLSSSNNLYENNALIAIDASTNDQNGDAITLDEKFPQISSDEYIHDRDHLVENNLMNSIFDVNMKIKNRLLSEKEFKNEDEKEKSSISLDRTDYTKNYEQEIKEVEDLNKTIKQNVEEILASNRINKIIESNNADSNSADMNEEFLNHTEYLDNNLNANDNQVYNIFSDPQSDLFPLKNSSLFKEYIPKENAESIHLNDGKTQHDKELNFLQQKDEIDSCQLYDLTKKKRYRAQGYYNENILNGSYLNSIIYNGKEINRNYKECAKRIFDMNDYNMSFEVVNFDTSALPSEKQKTKDQKEQQEKQINMTLQSNAGISQSEDFFMMFANQKLGGSGGALQPVMKIGKAKGNLLTHAKCAFNLTYNKINLTYDDLKDFHRPNFAKILLKEKKKRNFSFTISDKFNISHGADKKKWDCTILTRAYLKKKEKKRISKNIQYMNAYEIFKDRYKLSLVDGKYCLFEHIDENPLFLNNLGMASKLKKFLYTPRLFNSNVANTATKLTDVELKSYNFTGPYGSQILLNSNQKLPLIGQIDLNELKGLSIIDNKMYRAPVFYEKLKNPTLNISNQETGGKKYYNFLITFKKSKIGKEGFYIRELDHLYTVGQEEPKIEVYPPQSRQYCNFLKNKIKTYTFKLYDEIGYKAGINFKVFTNLFPNATEQILKKNFREMKIEIDKNICYFTKLPNEENQTLITPENVCQFESCQFGVYKLREVGIKNLTNPDKISYATNKFINQTPNLKQQFLGKVIEEELLTTPWNITQNFLQAKQIKGMLAIKGIGDPSNGMGGYSFLKMPVKSYNDNKTLKEEIDQLKTMNKNIKTVTGTDADLRKLSKDDIKLKLIQLGEDEEYINRLSRWERVSLLRYKSSKAAELGYEGDITKYARGARMSSKVQRDAYQKNINDVFKKQIQYIKGENIQTISDDSSDEENENTKFVSESDKVIKLKETADTFEDKKKGLGFMRNEIYANSSIIKKKKRPEGKRSGIIPNETNKKFDEGIIKIYKKNQPDTSDEISTKIKFDMKNLDIDLLRRKKKSSQPFDNMYEYEMDKTTSLISRKRRDTPEKTFNEMIEDIIDDCIKFDVTKIFHLPVKKKDYQDYYQIIKNPIDLGTMKNKTKRYEYKTVDQFISDLDLMVHNSFIYNGENHDVTLQANKIRELAMTKINE